MAFLLTTIDYSCRFEPGIDLKNGLDAAIMVGTHLRFLGTRMVETVGTQV